MRYFQARWWPMSQIKNCHQTFKKQEDSGPGLSGNTPDLKPIENLWVVLKNKVSEQQPSSFEHLENVIKIRTHDTTFKYCFKLIESMPRRLNMVIENKSGNIKY